MYRTLGIVAVLVVLGVIYWLFDPSDGNFPKCPFFLVTGLKCAGCGSQRALHDLLHLDIIGAWQHNRMLVLALPYVLVGLFLEYAVPRHKYLQARKWYQGQFIIWFWFVVLVTWSVVRNFVDM
jgi:hypothetical protein